MHPFAAMAAGMEMYAGIFEATPSATPYPAISAAFFILFCFQISFACENPALP